MFSTVDVKYKVFIIGLTGKKLVLWSVIIVRYVQWKEYNGQKTGWEYNDQNIMVRIQWAENNG